MRRIYIHIVVHICICDWIHIDTFKRYIYTYSVGYWYVYGEGYIYIYARCDWICIYVRTHLCMYLAHMNIHVRECGWICVYMYTYKCIHIDINIDIHICIHTDIYV